jgi:phage tail sheath protein FI
MPEYLSPGVYVEEVDTGNKPIEGVSTSTVGFLGVAERGPTKPKLTTSFTDYVRNFGRYVPGSFLAYGVEGFFQNEGKRCFVARVAPANAVPAGVQADTMLVTAVGVGPWANGRVAVKVSPAGLTNPNVPASSQLFKLTVIYWDQTVLNLPNPPLDPTDPTLLRNQDFRYPTILETYDNLSPDPKSGSYYEVMVNDVSVLVTVRRLGDGRPGDTSPLVLLDGGTPGDTLTKDDFVGRFDPDTKSNSGLAGLEDIDEISILCSPDEFALPDFQVTELLVEQSERLKDRFAIVQSPQAAPSVDTHRPSVVSKYAGYYYPWLRILDPLTQQELEIPPGGHLAGVYARSDSERGVHKAPANEIFRGILVDPLDPSRGLQVQVNKGQQDLLNPRGVNVLRYFPGRGSLVWGARTTTLDPDWKYVNVRRLFIFVEKSIDRATQWVVFEPNDEPLWARVIRSVSDFLTRLWIDGMLQGRTKEEAYFVRCDRTTMTQADIDNGRLIVLIGIAPVKPAEFVIFRIGQWTGGSDITEGQ